MRITKEEKKILAIVLLVFVTVIVVLLPCEPEPEPVSMSYLQQDLPSGYDVASYGWSENKDPKHDTVTIRYNLWTGNVEEEIIFPDGAIGKIIVGTAVPVLSVNGSLMAMEKTGESYYYINLNESYESVLSRPILSTWVVSISENTTVRVSWYCHLRSGESGTLLNGKEVFLQGWTLVQENRRLDDNSSFPFFFFFTL